MEVILSTKADHSVEQLSCISSNILCISSYYTVVYITVLIMKEPVIGV